MKRLILVRHAKSSWANSDISDRERPLNQRGKEAAGKVGKWLATEGYEPDCVLSSTASRCQETWAVMAANLDGNVKVQFESGLYLAAAPEMLGYLHKAAGDTVLMVGHMPGIGEFARGLRRDPAPSHEMFDKYPTGAVTVLDFTTEHWQAVQMGTGKHVAYMTPKEM